MRILLLTAMLILPACGSQSPYPPKSADEIGQLIGIANASFEVAQKVYAGAPETEIEAATREMRTALDAAQDQTDEILRQVAKVDPMTVGSCIRSNHLEMHDIENMLPRTRSTWSMNVGQCAASTIVYFKAAPPAESSVLALALNVIDPIMLVAGTRGGMKRGALAHNLQSNESIIAKLGPKCERTGKASAAGEVSHRCAAYQVAIAVQPKLRALASQVPMRH